MGFPLAACWVTSTGTCDRDATHDGPSAPLLQVIGDWGLIPTAAARPPRAIADLSRSPGAEGSYLDSGWMADTVIASPCP